MILAILTSMFHQCYQRAEFMYHVSSIRYTCQHLLTHYLIVKGVAKIARKLGFDYAEAVVS